MKCSQEQTVYTRNNGVETLIVGIYVDDLILTGTSVEGVKEFKQKMMKKFVVDQRKNCIMLKQLAYAKKVLHQLKMVKCNLTTYLMEAKLQRGKDTK